MRVLLRGLFAATLAIVAVFTMAVVAHAQEAGLPSVPLSERIPTQGRTTPDSVHEVSSTPVASNLVGGTCDVVVTGANNGSVHPGSDILVTSANTVTVANVESEAGRSNIPASGPLTLADTVTIAVRLGADGLFSGGTLAVTFDCTPPPPPTTTTPPTSPPVFNCTAPDGTVITSNVENNGACSATSVPPPTVPPATPPTTLPHTGVSPWLAFVGGAFLISGVASVLTGKALKKLSR